MEFAARSSSAASARSPPAGRALQNWMPKHQVCELGDGRHLQQHLAMQFRSLSYFSFHVKIEKNCQTTWRYGSAHKITTGIRANDAKQSHGHGQQKLWVAGMLTSQQE
ncbi:hypothetical protein ACLKA6_007749 [Drosophila palustris]